MCHKRGIVTSSLASLFVSFFKRVGVAVYQKSTFSDLSWQLIDIKLIFLALSLKWKCFPVSQRKINGSRMMVCTKYNSERNEDQKSPFTAIGWPLGFNLFLLPVCQLGFSSCTEALWNLHLRLGTTQAEASTCGTAKSCPRRKCCRKQPF